MYFPILNELVGNVSITQDEVNKIDKLFRDSYSETLRSSFYEHNLKDILKTQEKLDYVINFLTNKDIIERRYFRIECWCEYCSVIRAKCSIMDRHIALWEFEEKMKKVKPSEIPKMDGYDNYCREIDKGIGVFIKRCIDREVIIE